MRRRYKLSLVAGGAIAYDTMAEWGSASWWLTAFGVGMTVWTALMVLIAEPAPASHPSDGDA